MNRETRTLRGQQTGRLLRCLLLMVLLHSLTGCALVHHYGAISGQVVDLDTGEPLEGAAVHASYYTTFYNMIDPTSWYLNSQETTTDANGKFIIPAQFAFAFRPMNLFDDNVLFVIFKPGYGCYGVRGLHGKDIEGSLAPGKFALIGLPQLKTRDERLESVACSPSSDVPLKSKIGILKLLNTELSSLGLQEYKLKN